MSSNPDVMDEFVESLRGHLVKAFDEDRVVKVNKRAYATFVHFYNYPAFFARGVSASEAENNHQMFSISPAKDGKVKLEHRVNMLSRDTYLPVKTGTPAAIGRYLAGHLNRIVRTVEPKYTHTKMNPRRRSPRSSEESKKAMELHHKQGISLKAAWAKVKKARPNGKKAASKKR